MTKWTPTRCPLLAAAALFGCAEKSRPLFPPGDETGGDEVAGGDDSPGAPILDGPVGDRYPCTVTKVPGVLLGGMFDCFGTAALSSLGPDYVLAHGRTAAPSRHDFTLSRVSPAGTVDDSLLSRNGNESSVYPALAATAGGVAAVWVEDDDLWFVEINAAGAKLVNPSATTAVKSITAMGETRLAAVQDGFGLLFVGDGAVHAARLGPNGQVSGSLQNLASATYGITDLALVSTTDGFVAAWAQAEQAGREVFLAALDDAAVPRSPPRRISRPTGGGYSSSHPSLAHANGRVLATWQEGWFGTDFENPQGHTVIRVAGFDAGGNATTPARFLQAPVVDVDNVAPDLVALGNDFGLIWSQGNIIYFCGGCVPDHGLRFAVLDGGDLGVQSPVLTLPATAGGGSLDATLAANGLELLSTFEIWFHTYAMIGVAGISCQ